MIGIGRQGQTLRRRIRGHDARRRRGPAIGRQGLQHGGQGRLKPIHRQRFSDNPGGKGQDGFRGHPGQRRKGLAAVLRRREPRRPRTRIRVSRID